jgi:AcrR family transcriptional regulator
MRVSERKAKRRTLHEPEMDPTAQRILSTFSERAKRAGIRSVVMGELATELGMSISTLYGHFPSKEHLVGAMVDRWCAELATHDALIEDEAIPIAARFRTWGDAWSDRIVQYSPAFFRDLGRDYPDQSARLKRDLEARKARGAGILRPHLRPELVPAAAFALLDLIYTHAHDSRLGEEVGVARRDVVRAALAIWARGALRKR